MYSPEDLITEEAEDDLERIIEGDEDVEQYNENIENENAAEGDNANERGEGNNDEGNQENKEKKRKVVRNPQPKLDAEALKKPRGLLRIESLFERVKFKGRGHEEHDLNVLMKTYEYWCHRLFPKFPFDDCIARLEKLGAKRPVQTYLKRIRLDMLTDSDERPEIINDELENPEEETSVAEDQFDRLLSQPPPSHSESVSTEWTEEQIKRMQENRELAQKKKLERLRQIQEKAASVMERSQTIQNSVDCEDTFSQTSLLNVVDDEEANHNSSKNAGVVMQTSVPPVADENISEDVEMAINENHNSEDSTDRRDDMILSQSEDASSEKYILGSKEPSSTNYSQQTYQETSAQITCDNPMGVGNPEQLENESNKNSEENTLSMEECDDDSTEILPRSNIIEQTSDDLNPHDKEQG